MNNIIMRDTRLQPTLLFFSYAVFLASPYLNAQSLQTSDGPATIQHWGYQLQGAPPSGELFPELLQAAPHDLLVIDFARFGDTSSLFTPSEIQAIKLRSQGNSTRRVVAAYISIGEASEFRSYWDQGWTKTGSAKSSLNINAPHFLGPVNPDWPESRKVRYWEAEWQAIIFNDDGTGWLDTIVRQGFDAAYLDIVDAYYFWGEEVAPKEKHKRDPANSQDAARRMIDFITEFTAHARKTNPDFFVIPQNGAFILNDADFAGPLEEDPLRRARFLDAVGAIAVEDVYFGGDKDENNKYNPDHDTIAILKKDFFAHGKPVFAVDYLTDQHKVERFLADTLGDGFAPYVAPTRDLNRLAPPAKP